MEKCNKFIKMSLEIAKTSLDQNTKHTITYLKQTKLTMKKLCSTFRQLKEQNLNTSEMGKFLLYVEINIEQVFNYCKESESVYCVQPDSIRQTLKDLFDYCAAFQVEILQFLQSLYGSRLGKEQDPHFYDVMITNINIASATSALSVAIMSKQWKMINDLFEILSDYFQDTDIPERSISCLRSQIVTFVTDTENQNSKARTRSIKIAQILIRTVFNVIQLYKPRTYDDIISSYCYIKMLCIRNDNHDAAYMCIVKATNIIQDVDGFISETILHDEFLNDLCEFKMNDDSKCLPGLILLTSYVMNQIMATHDKLELITSKTLNRLFLNVYDIICRNYNLWSYYHTAIPDFIMTSAIFVNHFNGEQFKPVELCLLEGVMNPQIVVAMISADLWILILRMNDSLRVETLEFFCITYERLKPEPMFYASPQRVVLSSTINRIFTIMSDEEKIDFMKLIPLNEKKIELWSCIQINQLMESDRLQYTKVVLKELSVEAIELKNGHFSTNDKFQYFLTILKAAATCHMSNINSTLKDDLISIWLKLCKLNIRSELFIEYFTNLCSVLETLARDMNLQDEDTLKVCNMIKLYDSSKQNWLYGVSLLLENDTKSISYLPNNSIAQQLKAKLLLVLSIQIIHVITTLENPSTKMIAFKLLIQLFDVTNPANATLRIGLYSVIKSILDGHNTCFAFIYNVMKKSKSLTDLIDSNRDQLNYYSKKCVTSSKFDYYHKCAEDVETNNSEVHIVESVVNDIDLTQNDNQIDIENGEPLPKVVRITTDVNNIIRDLEKNVELLNSNIYNDSLTTEQLSKLITIQNKLKRITK